MRTTIYIDAHHDPWGIFSMAGDLTQPWLPKQLTFTEEAGPAQPDTGRHACTVLTGTPCASDPELARVELAYNPTGGRLRSNETRNGRIHPVCYAELSFTTGDTYEDFYGSVVGLHARLLLGFACHHLFVDTTDVWRWCTSTTTQLYPGNAGPSGVKHIANMILDSGAGHHEHKLFLNDWAPAILNGNHIYAADPKRILA